MAYSEWWYCFLDIKWHIQYNDNCHKQLIKKGVHVTANLQFRKDEKDTTLHVSSSHKVRFCFLFTVINFKVNSWLVQGLKHLRNFLTQMYFFTEFCEVCLFSCFICNYHVMARHVHTSLVVYYVSWSVHTYRYPLSINAYRNCGWDRLVEAMHCNISVMKWGIFMDNLVTRAAKLTVFVAMVATDNSSIFTAFRTDRWFTMTASRRCKTRQNSFK